MILKILKSALLEMDAWALAFSAKLMTFPPLPPPDPPILFFIKLLILDLDDFFELLPCPREKFFALLKD